MDVKISFACTRITERIYLHFNHNLTYKRFSKNDEKENSLVENGSVVLLHIKDITHARSQGTKVRQPHPDFLKYAIESE